MRDDLRTALRSLIASPGVTLAALVVLTLGIGAGTAIFSVVDAVVLRGLPFDEHDRLVAVGERHARVDPADPDAVSVAAPQNYLDWLAQQRSFESMAAIASGWLTLRQPGGEPESLVPQRVTAPFFDVLRVHPAIGRAFTADNERQGRDRVAVISDGLWRRRFGGDPAIVGQTVQLEDVEGGGGAYEILGVMPRGFTYPVGAARPIDIWVPYVVPADQRLRSPARRVNYLQVIARLRPDVSIARAQAEMDGVAAALERDNPQWNKDSRIGVRPLGDHLVGARVRSWMLMLLGAVALVLLVACANVANLLVARAAARTREMGIRAALGASRARLARQVVVESLILSSTATACALVFAWWAIGILKASLPPDVPRVASIALNLRVFAVAAIAAFATGAIFGLAPALQLSKPDLRRALQDGTHGTAGPSRRRLRSALVVAEIAIAAVLLVGAALFTASFVSLMRIEPGFDPEHVLTAQFTPRVTLLPDGQFADRARDLGDLAGRLERIPGVTAAALVSGGLPFGGATTQQTLQSVEGVPLFAMINLRVITPGYHRALAIPLRAGRLFTAADSAGAQQVVIFNESAARQYFPGKDPIGRAVTLGADRVVVGIVGDIHQRSLETDPWPEAYIPMAQSTATGAEMAIRTAGDPMALLPSIRSAAFAAFPDVPLRNVSPLTDLVGRQIAQRRLNMQLLSLFGLLGLLIAAVGIYAVMAHAVAQRTAEIGIRMALGADRGDVLGMILRQACALIAGGLAIGGLAAWSLRAAAAGFLFHVRAGDPRAFAGAMAVLAITAFAASLVPARRATRVEPVVALKA